MVETTSNKKNHVIVIILSLLAVILLAAVFLQGKQLNKFLDGLDGKSRIEINTGNDSLEKRQSQNNQESYQQKIKNLKIKITEMQELQDHLEDALDRYYDKKDSATSNQDEMDSVSKAKADFYIRSTFLKQHIDFFEQNNYSPELNDKLFDLSIERHFALRDFIDDARKAGDENIRANVKELNRQIEEINTEYDDRIAEILSEDGLALLKEYEKRDIERSLIMHFKNMMGDDALGIEKERELIELMYKGRQIFTPLPNSSLQSYVFPENEQDAETTARLEKVKNKNMIKTLDTYVETAGGILSKSQTAKFKGFINILKKDFSRPDDTAVNGSDEEKE
ncbi:MAG: hypothetical protein JW927_20930 [Deltaproteobacteria bacterium]|nr:hypothetical protein [Deltaproteobacteria bacterium]